jgi:hypothetical protein
MRNLPESDPAFAIPLNGQSVVDLAEGAVFHTLQDSDTPPHANTHTEEGSAREDFAKRPQVPSAVACDVAPSAPGNLQLQRARAVEALELASTNWFSPLE